MYAVMTMKSEYAVMGFTRSADLWCGYTCGYTTGMTNTENLIAKVRFDSRVAQLVGEMITEGWDRKTATAIAKEFAKAGA